MRVLLNDALMRLREYVYPRTDPQVHLVAVSAPRLVPTDTFSGIPRLDHLHHVRPHHSQEVSRRPLADIDHRFWIRNWILGRFVPGKLDGVSW